MNPSVSNIFGSLTLIRRATVAKTRIVFSIGAMHGGGSERQMISLLRNLDRDRFEPHLYLIYRQGPLLAEVPDDVPVVSFEDRAAGSRLYLPGLNHRRRVRDLTCYLQESRAHVSYDRTFLMTLIAADAAQRAGVPNVSTIVTDPRLGFAPVAGRFQRTKRRLLHRLYSQSTQVLANSEGAARSAEQFYDLPAGTVDVHYNGLDLAAIAEKSRQPIDDDWWTADGNRPVLRIVTAGRLNREKGFHLLIDAVAALQQQQPERECRLAILGEGGAHAALQQQIDGHHLGRQIQLVGFRQNAPAWYKSADVFVLPSFLEGMPNVLLESMAVRTSVISTDCPSGPSEILQDGRFGQLIPVNDVSALTMALSQQCEQQQEAADHQKRLEAAHQRVLELFTIQSATNRLQNIFDHLTSRTAS